MSILRKIFYTLLSTVIFVIFLTNVVKAETVKITADTLNLREKPSTNSDIIALIYMGAECELLEEEDNWYKVKYDDYTGYISKEYAEKTEENTDNTVDTNSNNTDIQENNNDNVTGVKDNISGTTLQGKITKKANIRIVPLINSEVLEILNEDEIVKVVEKINNWVYIQTEEISGWIRSEFISIEEVKDNTNKDDNNKDNDKDDNKETDKNSDKNTSEPGFKPKTMYTKDYVNIRKNPSTEADILMLVEVNTKLEVIGEDGNWYKVNTSEGEAYVSKDVLSDKEVKITNRGNIDRKPIEVSDVNKTSTSSDDSNVKGSKIVSYAKKFLGVPYVYGGANSSGFDCSGFTMYVFDHFGISMGHGAQMQSREGTAVKTNKNSRSSLLNNLEVGDLVFFLDYETMDEIGHCGIYIGNGEFIHASSGSGYCVKVDSLLPGNYYNTRYCAARRVI